MDLPSETGEPSWGSPGQEKGKQKDRPKSASSKQPEGGPGKDGWSWGQGSPKGKDPPLRQSLVPAGTGLKEGQQVPPSPPLRR